MPRIIENLKGFAESIFIVDSYSTDKTIDIALENNIYIIQREFKSFSDQWNFALTNLPIKTKWTMKMDPDEIISDELKKNISDYISKNFDNPFYFHRRLWFLGGPLSIKETVLRGWRTGTCKFSNVLVNEHPICEKKAIEIKGYLEHFDSPNMEHWLKKQNFYTSLEANALFDKDNYSFKANLFGNSNERRMWIKKNFRNIPFNIIFLFFYYYFFRRLIFNGYRGYAYSLSRAFVMSFRGFKYFEINKRNIRYSTSISKGNPDKRVIQS